MDRTKLVYAPEDNFIVIVERRLVLVWFLVIAQVETNVEEQFSSLVLVFHLCCWETVNEPIDGIVLSDTVVDEFRVVC